MHALSFRINANKSKQTDKRVLMSILKQMFTAIVIRLVPIDLEELIEPMFKYACKSHNLISVFVSTITHPNQTQDIL